MTYGELATKLRKFCDDLSAHRDLYAESVDRTIPRYPIRNNDALERQQRELNRQLYTLDRYIDRFTKGRFMHHPATGVRWDVYREAVGTNVGPIKGASLTNAITELEGIIAVVEQEPSDQEVSFERPSQEPSPAGAQVPKTQSYGSITITGGNVVFGDGAKIDINSVTVLDILRGIEAEISTKVEDPKEKKSLLSRLNEISKHPLLGTVLQTTLPELLKRFSSQ